VDYAFCTKIYYPVGELPLLKTKISEQEQRRLFCHIALFEGLKFLVTFPSHFDITLIADGLGPESLTLFREVAGRAWSQHMYENGVVDYWGPAFIDGGKLGVCSPMSIPPRSDGKKVILASNGGGKDSFLVMKVLEQADISMSVFQHARTEYGRLKHQHELQDKVYKHIKETAIEQVHRISVVDDYTEGTFVSAFNPQLLGDSTFGNPCQVGWPEMVFESLVFVLNHGYFAFTLGNERSADTAQAQWSAMGDRQVNHQWLKSAHAQEVLRDFLGSHLVSSFDVFSMLKPVHDYRIYRAISRFPAILPDIHSCNVQKPWCKRCSKCCYVWINLCAVYGHQLVDPYFNENLLSVPELQEFWRELLGLSSHNAWECVGETDETRLAFRVCSQAGMQGLAMDTFIEQVQNVTTAEDWQKMLNRFDQVYDHGHNIPVDIFEKVAPYLNLK